ncbi:hypothetical protein NKDENANG_00327 [Candidatus Entotheonellaceae bacterium PAL068K]
MHHLPIPHLKTSGTKTPNRNGAVRWGLRDKIFALMGSLVLGLPVATLGVVGLQASRAAQQRIRVDLPNTRRPFEAFQRLRYQGLLALSRVLGRTYALRNAVSTYHSLTVCTARTPTSPDTRQFRTPWKGGKCCTSGTCRATSIRSPQYRCRDG